LGKFTLKAPFTHRRIKIQGIDSFHLLWLQHNICLEKYHENTECICLPPAINSLQKSRNWTL